MAPSSRNEHTGIEERQLQTAINNQRMTNPKSPPDIQSHVADSHNDSEDNEDSSDDDIGPQLYTHVSQPRVTRSDRELDSQETLQGDIPANSVKQRRDDWMVLPPDKGSPSSDRLQLRNRKFNTSKDVPKNTGSFTPWTESHEQKKRRLENEILGIEPPSEGQRGNPVAGTPKSNEAMAERVKLSNSKSKALSLYETFQEDPSHTREDDDPSSRPFDREKDLVNLPNATSAKRRKFTDQISKLDSRFSGGYFLK